MTPPRRSSPWPWAIGLGLALVILANVAYVYVALTHPDRIASSYDSGQR